MSLTKLWAVMQGSAGLGTEHRLSQMNYSPVAQCTRQPKLLFWPPKRRRRFLAFLV